MVRSQNMLSSFFEGMTPTDIAHQYAEEASDLPPNLEDVSFETTYPGGNFIQMPSNVAFKTLQIIILNEENAKKYSVSQKSVDDFKVINERYNVIGNNKEKRDFFRDAGRAIYKNDGIYDAVVEYHRTHR